MRIIIHNQANPTHHRAVVKRVGQRCYHRCYVSVLASLKHETKVRQNDYPGGFFLPCFMTLILAFTSFFTKAVGIGWSMGKLTIAFVVG